jgi:MraZ protein
VFRGNYPARVDEKGRLKIPADLKRLVDEKYGNQFYITSRDGRVAEVYPLEEWQRVEEKLAKVGSFNEAKKKFLSQTNYWGQVVEVDPQGRVLLPQMLRENADLKGEVAVVGNLLYLEIRNMDSYRKQVQESQLTSEDAKVLDDLGI